MYSIYRTTQRFEWITPEIHCDTIHIINCIKYMLVIAGASNALNVYDDYYITVS